MTIPRFHDERLGRLPEEFFLALGHLQYAYTSLEVSLTCAISEVVTAGYDYTSHFPLHDRIGAVLGGMRMDSIKDTLKRLLRVMDAPPEVSEFLADVLKQLSEIQFLRNRLTHYYTSSVLKKDGVFVNTDLEVAREKAKAVTIQFSLDALDAARHDLHAISLVTGDMFDFSATSFPLKLPAWQYKPSMLTR